MFATDVGQHGNAVGAISEGFRTRPTGVDDMHAQLPHRRGERRRIAGDVVPTPLAQAQALRLQTPVGSVIVRVINPKHVSMSAAFRGSVRILREGHASKV